MSRKQDFKFAPAGMALLASVHALLRQCEDVKKNAQGPMQIAGIKQELLETLRKQAQSSATLKQLQQTNDVKGALSSITSEIGQRCREIEQRAETAGCRKVWGRDNSNMEEARARSRSLIKSRSPKPSQLGDTRQVT